MKAEEFLKERDIPNEVITVQRDGFIEGNRVSFLMEEYAKSQQPSDSAGEEVYDVAISELDTNAVNWRGATVVLAEHFERVAENISDRITRPTVSEGEIESADDRCPKCKSIYIMEHRYDDSYKICMSCKYNWKT